MMTLPTLPAGTAVLRPPRITDAQRFFEHATSKSQMTETLLWDAHDTVAETEEALQWFCDQNAADTAWHWLIEVDNEPVGEISVRFGELPDLLADAVVTGTSTGAAGSAGGAAGEVGYYLSPNYWGKGIMRAALQAIVAHMRKVRPELWLWASVDPKNGASVRVLEYGGLEFAALKEKSKQLASGVVRDTAYYVLPA